MGVLSHVALMKIGRKKTREVSSLGPMMGGHQSVHGNDRAERNDEAIHNPPRKSARIAMAKSNDGPPSYFDVLSNELVVHIFHMLTGGPEWHLSHGVERWRSRWCEEGREEEKQVAERYLNGIALSSTCTRMRAIESVLRYPLKRLMMPLNNGDADSFISCIFRKERRFDRIIVICSESASLDVICNLRNVTKELSLPPDDMRISDPKVSFHVPTIGGNYDVTTLIESMLFKHIHYELSTNGPEMLRLMNKMKTGLEGEQEGIQFNTIQEMRSIGYVLWEPQINIKSGRLVARNEFGHGFICGEEDQREVKIQFIVHLSKSRMFHCDVQLVSERRYSGYVANLTREERWHENQSTWLGIALRLYRDAIGWEDAEWDTEDDASDDDLSEMGSA
jgi:hypothetical protein